MCEMERRLKGQFILLLIRLVGIFSICLGVKELLLVNDQKIIYNLIGVALFYLVFSPMAATLPSGAKWRPAMAFIFFSILFFDYRLVIFIALPGTLYVCWGEKKFLSRFLQTLGHLTIGIYGAGLVRELMHVEFSANLQSYLAMTFCLFVHFLLNRLVAALIVSFRNQRSLKRQILLIRKDLNWGYFCAYVLGILMFLVYRVYRVPGLLLVILLLISIFQAVSYFQKLKDIEEKVYIDALTGAENRLSWEEYQEQLDQEKVNRSGAVFMMDLDHFKMMNDTFGHDFGDGILKEFVNHMKRNMKRQYRLFRYGGDEFILVVPSPVEEYSFVCSDVSAMLFLQDKLWKQKGFAVSVSFGYTFLSEHESIASIVRKADKLMYMKKFQKNIVKNSNADEKMLIKC
jgi:diguanylate cyclase (GGDEF)-like protein